MLIKPRIFDGCLSITNRRVNAHFFSLFSKAELSEPTSSISTLLRGIITARRCVCEMSDGSKRCFSWDELGMQKRENGSPGEKGEDGRKRGRRRDKGSEEGPEEVTDVE